MIRGTTEEESMATFTNTQLHDIQGFGIAGFNKDHQEAMFVQVNNATGGRRLLSWLQPLTASAWEVGIFNQLFSEVKVRMKREPLAATWFGLLISAAGYRALGVATSGLPSGPGTTAFNAGMAARASTIGDTSTLDTPTSWLEPFRSNSSVHLCIVIAADRPDDLDAAVEMVGNQVSATGCTVVFQERGDTLPHPLTGHEHFGFKDGLSQPAIVGYTTPPPVAPAPAAVNAGEFVLGCPDAETNTAQTTGTLWKDGSFVVFRRLHQNVAAFRAQTSAGVPGSNPTLDTAQMGAALVGRWPSGAPLELHQTPILA
jgi:deferrochelatase/peroxidase EfeB